MLTQADLTSAVADLYASVSALTAQRDSLTAEVARLNGLLNPPPPLDPTPTPVPTPVPTPTPTPVPVPTPTPSAPGWKLLKQFDLSSDGGLWGGTNGINTRDGSFNSMASAKFGTGPKKTGLTIQARRTGASSYSSADIWTRGKFNVPNYFRAEVVAKVSPLVSGMWPAPLWFRPDGAGEGEIDVMELWGKEALPRQAHHTLIKTPYAGESMVHHNVSWKTLGDTTGGEQMHTYTVEKTPGKMLMFIDGKLTATFLPGEAVQGTTNWWNSIMEKATQKWYPRICFQVGPGTAGDHTGPVPASWTASDLYIDSLAFWVPA